MKGWGNPSIQLNHLETSGNQLRSRTAQSLADDQSGLIFAKCPAWTGERLLVLDAHDRRIKSMNDLGEIQVEQELPYLPSGLLRLPDGDLLVSSAWPRVIHRIGESGSTVLASLGEAAGTCKSDAIAACSAGLYVCDVGYNYLDPLADPKPNGEVLFVDNSGIGSCAADGLFFPNAMVITPDEKTLIVAELLGQRLTAFDIATDGSLSNRRLWVQMVDNHKPDGICLDSDGAIWIATTEACALRVLEGGEIVDEVTTRQKVFDVALGGKHGTDLFLCTAESSDPVSTRLRSSAMIELSTVCVPGVTAD